MTTITVTSHNLDRAALAAWSASRRNDQDIAALATAVTRHFAQPPFILGMTDLCREKLADQLEALALGRESDSLSERAS